MAWQAPHFIYPQQGKENPVESAMRGLSQSLVLANQIRGVRDANKQDALNADIKAAYEESAAKIAELEKNNVPQEAKGKNISPIPQQKIDLTALTGVNGIADPRVGQSPIPQSGPSLKDRVDTSIENRKQDDFQNRKIELNSQMANKIIGLYYKHGFADEAAKLERNFMEQAASLAKIDPRVAERVWNNSLLSDRYGRVKFKDADAKWKELKDGSGLYNETDPSQIVKHPRTIDDFIGKEYKLREGQEVRTIIRTKDGIKEVTLAANPKKKEDKPPVTRTIKQGEFEITQEYAGNGKWRQIGKAPRYKNGEGASGSGGNGGSGTAKIGTVSQTRNALVTKYLSFAGDKLSKEDREYYSGMDDINKSVDLSRLRNALKPFQREAFDRILIRAEEFAGQGYNPARAVDNALREYHKQFPAKSNSNTSANQSKKNRKPLSAFGS